MRPSLLSLLPQYRYGMLQYLSTSVEARVMDSLVCAWHPNREVKAGSP